MAPLSDCSNCATPLAGRFCHTCGQNAVPTERSLFRLVVRWLREALDLDGRLFASLRLLVTRPGALSRAYMQGRRTDYLGPLRLLAVCFFVDIQQNFFVTSVAR